MEYFYFSVEGFHCNCLVTVSNHTNLLWGNKVSFSLARIFFPILEAFQWWTFFPDEISKEHKFLKNNYLLQSFHHVLKQTYLPLNYLAVHQSRIENHWQSLMRNTNSIWSVNVRTLERLIAGIISGNKAKSHQFTNNREAYFWYAPAVQPHQIVPLIRQSHENQKSYS